MAIQYDTNQPLLYTIPQTGATVDLNSLPETAIDQLIAQVGGQPPILARKAFLEQQRKAGEQEAQGRQTMEQMAMQEAAKRTDAALQQRLDSIFGQAERAGVQRIDQDFGQQRAKAVAEEAALGRLRSPVSAASMGQLDQRRDNAMTQLFGNLAGQRAAGQLDVSKTIEGILSGDRDRSSREKLFGQELQFNRDKLLSDINQANEDRGLNRFKLDAMLRQERDMFQDRMGNDFDRNIGRVDAGLDVFNKARKTGADLAFLFGKGG